jgi:hypothetical protein
VRERKRGGEYGYDQESRCDVSFDALSESHDSFIP